MSFDFLRKTKEKTVEQGISVDLNSLIDLKYQARALSLENHKRVSTLQAGNYLSGFKGRGIDFEEVRIYQPGDDIRNMDWRVTARTGRPHTKLYKEERERPIFLIVDFSPTMFFGTRIAFKSVVAAKAAAILAWASLENNDRVAAILFNGNDNIEFPPKSKHLGIIPLLKSLSDHTQEKVETDNTHGLSNSLMRLRRVVRPGSLIFILSDFSSLNKEAEQHLSMLSQHNELTCCYIHDPMEAELPPPNLYTISDGDEFAAIDTTVKSTCWEYRQQFKTHLQALRYTFQKRKIPMMTISTEQNIVERLRKELIRR